MAAGLGTRLMPFTERTPKPVMPVMGIPLVQYSLSLLSHYNIQNVAMNLHTHPDQIQRTLEGIGLKNMTIQYSDETKKLLGSGGGIVLAQKQCPFLKTGSFFRLNSDVISSVDLAKLASRHQYLKEKHDVLMTLAVRSSQDLEGTYREIKFNSTEELVTEISEPRKGAPFFTGVAVIEASAFDSFSPGQEMDLVQSVFLPAIETGRMGVFHDSGLWMDIGDPSVWQKSHFELMKRCEQGELPSWLSELVLSQNKKVSPGCWASSNFQPNQQSGLNWQSPCYYNGVYPRKELGPRTVLYEGASNLRDVSLSDSIHFDGNSVSVDVKKSC